MAGRGPAPKPAGRRVRRNSDPIPSKVIPFHRGTQPELPEVQPSGDPWPAATVDWWRRWGESALADGFTATDWDFLLDTALLHARLWSGDASAASELRLRVSKLGATAEDRARLRIVFADADTKEARAGERKKAPSARDRYSSRTLRAVDGA